MASSKSTGTLKSYNYLVLPITHFTGGPAVILRLLRTVNSIQKTDVWRLIKTSETEVANQSGESKLFWQRSFLKASLGFTGSTLQAPLQPW